MSETTTREETKREKPAKRGLHGWKAALAVFGCGTLAAFGVFGVVVSLLGTLVTTVSSGLNPREASDGSAPEAVAPTLEAREEFLEDKFDLCSITLPSISGSGLSVEDSPPVPVDSSNDGGPPAENDLVRSGECEGFIQPAAGIPSTRPWEFRFSYSAIIFAPGDNREELAGESFEEWSAMLEAPGFEMEEAGNLDFLEESYYVYGSSGGEGKEYAFVSRKRSAVLMLELSSGDGTSIPQFESEVRKLERNLVFVLDDLIPA
ncbi:hypothetical protein [Nocardiopsis alba]|uniref:hypothetical protein n=1 Tax=Nocardiopsis alba TaxID=53437 RepID=UPI003407A0AE